MCSPASISACAVGGLGQREACACTIGCTSPSATSGQTCSTTDAQIAAFSSAGRAAAWSR